MLKRNWRRRLDLDKPLRISGVDTISGLNRLGGKRERYESLLRKFAARHGGMMESIRATLSAGDFATAERDLHSLRGAAATLGAEELAAAAARAEEAIKSGQTVDSALETVAESLGSVVTAIRTELPE
jgi:two-component system, sensor histidine kinase and response regulator